METQEALDRRDFLRQSALAGIGVGAALLGGAGCGVAHDIRQQARGITGPAPPEWLPLPPNADAATSALHVLNRVAFGPRPGEVTRVAALGAAAYIESQLADTLDEDPAVNWRVNGLDVQQTERDAPDALYSLSEDQLLEETQQAALLRAVYSRHQLRETLADFWTNHFNIYALKGDGRILIPIDTERVIRPYVLTSFRDLLLGPPANPHDWIDQLGLQGRPRQIAQRLDNNALLSDSAHRPAGSAHSPAMLSYLDNQQNRRGVANENYARELLELHTLGVKSGYTQRDIQEVARCFTGWTVTTGFNRGQFTYDRARHDNGGKFIPFLNLTIAPNGGQKDAEAVLEQLVLHPATARFLSRKLCRRFLGQAPDDVVEKAANAYRKHQSDIRATLRPILLDALLVPELNRPVFKRPLEMTVSALRALAADTDGAAPLQRHLTAMGQPLYQWPMPDGFPEKISAWTGSLLPRWNFALALAANAIPGTTVDLHAPLAAARASNDAAIRNTLLEIVLARPYNTPACQSLREQLGRHMQAARQAALPDATVIAEATGLLLASPAFQWR